MQYVKGDILSPDDFEEGYLGFDRNKIVESGKGHPPKKPVAEGLIVPTFVNAHTHIGDSFIKKRNIELPRNVEELVAPPNGLKHQLLRNTSTNEIINGMKESISQMMKIGTSHFCDFRENGISGINQLKNALINSKISSIILSRPKKMEYRKEEIELLLKNSDGIGISSISDWDYSELLKVARHVNQRKKILSLHGSEAVREDIDLILDLKPSFLIHMVKATESDLILVKENNIPIVICPRSNDFFGLKTNFKLLKQMGIDLMIGTDNAMINTPNILDELNYLKNNTDIFSIKELLNMITYVPRKVLNLECDILGPTSMGDFVVLEKKSLKLLYISDYNNRGLA
jgi:cytosine/adenosine deaminase-related metal-dependent hydrolase